MSGGADAVLGVVCAHVRRAEVARLGSQAIGCWMELKASARLCAQQLVPGQAGGRGPLGVRQIRAFAPDGGCFEVKYPSVLTRAQGARKRCGVADRGGLANTRAATLAMPVGR